MGTEKDNRILKILLGLAILLLIVLGTYTYRMYHKNEDIKDLLTIEKTELEKDLEDISRDYMAELEKGTALTSDFKAAQKRIARLRDSVSKLEPNVALISRLRKELKKIKDEREVLKARVYVLEQENESLTRVNDSTLQLLNSEMIRKTQMAARMDTLNDNMSTLEINMARAAVLIPTNFKSEGVIIRSSGKQIENDRARRVDDFKVCFTLPQNALAPTGVQSFYLQVINPDNNVLGLKKKQIFDEQELIYSSIVNFNYNGKELDICELVQANEDDIIKGRYRVNLYNGNVRISSDELVLR